MKRSRKERIARASERTKERAERTDHDQLNRLFQQGHGHCREAKRLLKRVVKETP